MGNRLYVSIWLVVSSQSQSDCKGLYLILFVIKRQEADPLWDEHKYSHHPGDWIVFVVLAFGAALIHSLFRWQVVHL